MPTGVVLCEDSDLLRFEPNLDEFWPRTDRKTGDVRRDWSVQRKVASQEIERQFRVRKSTFERFELGRCSDRTKSELVDACANLAMHYIFVAADSQGDESGFFSRKATHYWERATTMIEGVALMVDYDADNSGTFDASETDRPMPMRFIRG